MVGGVSEQLTHRAEAGSKSPDAELFDAVDSLTRAMGGCIAAAPAPVLCPFCWFYSAFEDAPLRSFMLRILPSTPYSRSTSGSVPLNPTNVHQ